jgi:hypothetical protein
MADIINPEMLGLERQRAMAQALIKRGMETPEGQMVSGRYVGASPLQYIGNLFNQYAGQKGLESVDAQQLALADKLRQQGVSEVGDILTLAQGRPELPSQELAGPSYNGIAPSIQYPAIAGDTQAALAKALTGVSPQAQALAPTLMQNLLPKKTNELINYEAAKQGGFKGSFDEWRNQLTPFQKEELRISNARLGLEAANQNKAQFLETPNGYVAVNPKNPNQATPVMLNGQPIMGSKGNLPEGATGQVTGVQNVKSALSDLKTNLKDFKTFDMANPNKRALMATDYENVILQLKEAMKLGVLNGNDYTILTSMITNPNAPGALLINKETQMKQIDNLEKKLNDMTSNVYKTHQRNVPSNLQQPEISNAITTNKQVPVLKYNLQTGNWE